MTSYCCILNPLLNDSYNSKKCIGHTGVLESVKRKATKIIPRLENRPEKLS